MIPTTKTTSTAPRITSATESAQNSTTDSNANIWRRQMIDTNSAPSTPTGHRNFSESYNPLVPILPVRSSSFGSDALSCCTPDYPDRSVISVSSSSSTTNLECASNNSIRNVNIYDLIDEEFVVNCGASLANINGESMKRRNSHSSNTCTSKPGHRRRKSILDMIDRIVTSDDENTLVMTTRSYPRGVYVVTPNERETTTTGNTVAFVSAEAYKQW